MTWFRRAVRLLPLIALFVLCASCSDFWVSNSDAASIKLSQPALILTASDTYSLTATETTVGGSTKDVTPTAKWTSNNAAITVTGGKITVSSTAAKDIKATVTVSTGGQSATCSILTYTGTTPTGTSAITISYPSSLAPNSLTAGQQFKLTATMPISGDSPNPDVSSYVSWVPSNTAVATIDANGNVTVLSTAVAGNNFTVTATAQFASSTASGTSTSFSLPSII